jgi:sigma-E factor negative regulatory protein RseC
VIEQQARVLRAEGDRISVRIGGQSGCNSCDEGKGCGAGLFGRLLKRHPVELDFENHIGARSGQAVQLGLPEALFMRLVFRLYALPLFTGLLGASAGFVLADRAGMTGGWLDLATLAGAVIIAAPVLIFWNRTTRHDVSSSDIRLLDRPLDGSTCGTSARGIVLD